MTRVYRYDDKKRLVATELRNPDGSLAERRTFSYDAAGHVDREEFRPSGGTLHSYTTFRYDSAGRAIEEREVRADGTVDRVISTAYDTSTGRRAKVTRKDGAGRIQNWTVFRYDPKTRTEEAIEYDASGKKTGDNETYRYDAKGRLIHYSEAIQSVDHTYDADGNLLRSVDTGGEGDETRYFYDCWE
ncbi:MAG: hypothetical protein ABIK09_08420 [Pseudomonadota bacterium]